MPVNHLVLFQFKADASAEQVEKVGLRLRQNLKRFEGTNTPRRHTQNGIQYAFVVEFESIEDRDFYVNIDQAHKAFVASALPIIEKWLNNDREFDSVIPCFDFTLSRLGTKHRLIVSRVSGKIIEQINEYDILCKSSAIYIHSLCSIINIVTLGTCVVAYDNLLGFNGAPEVETRTIDEIYEAAVVEGGDEAMQQDGLKAAFEARFPKMTLNLTVDLSKYQDGDIDHQLVRATDDLYVDSVILDIRGAWHATAVYPWTFTWNMDRVANGPMEFTDFLKPEFKDTLVLTYPTDDDASLYAFDLILQEFGIEWFDALLTQNPHWVRGTQTAATLMSSPNSTAAATFTSIVGLSPSAPLNISIPTKGHFNTWPQRAAILKDAPHPEGAKLLHNFILSKEYQRNTGVWSVRRDVPAPAGFPELIDIPSTDPTEFQRFLADRARVERSRFFFESKLGTPQGPSSVNNGI
ncbi:hypothetical protein CHU98_g5456 [Xylaria longipes]|nr:hypothetical protein CHU98_g5456 [Xylaria longipes]